jgi:hypothetical protein
MIREQLEVLTLEHLIHVFSINNSDLKYEKLNGYNGEECNKKKVAMVKPCKLMKYDLTCCKGHI